MMGATPGLDPRVLLEAEQARVRTEYDRVKRELDSARQAVSRAERELQIWDDTLHGYQVAIGKLKAPAVLSAAEFAIGA